jgi:hypothetical protein
MWRLTGVVWAQAWFRLADPGEIDQLSSTVPEVRARSAVYVPLWVMNRHSAMSASRLLHPDKQTLIGGLFTFGGDPLGKSEWRIASWEAAEGGHPGQEGSEETA